MIKVVFFNDDAPVKTIEKWIKTTDKSYLVEKIDKELYTDNFFVADMAKYDLIIITRDCSALKNILKNEYRLKFEVNNAAKRDLLNTINKRFVGFDEYLLPKDFELLTEDAANVSFGGKVGERFLAVLNERETNIDFCLKKIKDIGLVADRRYLCFKMFGVDELASKVNSYMSELDCEEVEWRVFYEFGDLALYVYFTDDANAATIKNIEHAVYLRFGEEIYADFDAEMQEVLVYLASISGIKISTAESLTGGLVADKIISVPSASKVIDVSLVTYANFAKQTFLDVNPELIKIDGVVSKGVAEQMAEGLVKKYGCDLGISTTGIAGPTGQTPNKPIGLVYIGIASVATSVVEKYIFEGNRDSIRQLSANAAIFNAIKFINKL